jgi:hypothetical protein
MRIRALLLKAETWEATDKYPERDVLELTLLDGESANSTLALDADYAAFEAAEEIGPLAPVEVVLDFAKVWGRRQYALKVLDIKELDPTADGDGDLRDRLLGILGLGERRTS